MTIPVTDPILSHFQAEVMLAARRRGEPVVSVSLDLGVTTAVVQLDREGVLLADGRVLTLAQLEEIRDNELACYRLHEDGAVGKIQFFSPTFNRFYSLMPTIGAPTMLISGIPMHRIKGTDPHRDTLSKIKAVKPVVGAVLDTTMGLGYTAIAAAETADHVTTIELDPTVVEICRHNPWSRALFNNPKITRIIGDAFEVTADMEDGAFSRIIHDPPTFSLAGELYSGEFYRRLYRLLGGNGRLFHYIGDPDSKSGGGVTRGAVRRLQEAGFRRIKPAPRAFGVVAYK